MIQSHSRANARLAALTAPNHWAYATRHGYDMRIFVAPWDTAKWAWINWVRTALEHYEHVFTIGSDVIITRPEIPLSRFYRDGYGAVVAQARKEQYHNDDTLLINANDKGRFFLDYLEARRSAQTELRSWNAIGELRRTRPGIVASLPIQGFPVAGQHSWTPRYFCLHMINGSVANKVRRVSLFLRTNRVPWGLPPEHAKR